MTLYELLARAAARDPAATALAFRDVRLSYGELLAMVDGCAAGLAALDVRRRSRVALMLPNCPPFVIAYFAAAKLGATIVPINVLYRPDEVRYILADSGVSTLVTAEPFRPLTQALRPLAPDLRHVVMVAEDGTRNDEVDFRAVCAHRPATPARVTERDVAAILYTSGTTGRPKGAMLTHRNLVSNADACSAILHVGAGDCFLSALPLFHAFAALVCMVLPVSVGARIHLIERFVPSDTLKALEESGATLFAGVPSMFGLMLQTPPAARPPLRALRLCISGGAPLPPEIWTAFEQAFDVTMIEGYGLTEASPVVAVNPPQGVRKVGSIGTPLPGVEARILDDAGRALGPGAIGELVVRGPNVMRGYLNRPEETRQAIRHRWLYTGDLASMDGDGYLYVVGRKKELIIVGGLNVYPGEVERVLVEHPAVLEAAAFGVADAARGEAVWAAVVLRPDAPPVNARALQAWCREKLASYKAPRGIALVDALPKTALGKVARHELRHLVDGR